MQEDPAPTILGVGYKVPETIRRNDDPIFSYLNELANVRGIGGPFYGYETRHVLGRFEKLVDIMKPAAEEAMATANVEPKDIDVLLGCASVSQYTVPSDLYELHKELKLPSTTLAVPFGNDFSNFNVAFLHADALIRSGHARTALIAIGGSWSRAVDYHTVQSISAGDGAAAVVVGRCPSIEEWQSWTVVDKEVLADTSQFGVMYLSDVVQTDPTQRRQRQVPIDVPDPADWPSMPTSSLCSMPCFHITEEGQIQYNAFGGDKAWKPAVKLLQRRGITGSQITLIGHQASDRLSDKWEKNIGPARFFKTTKQYANMTVATIPVNLALALSPFKKQERAAMGLGDIATPYVLLLALGPDLHAHALLLGKVGSIPT